MEQGEDECEEEDEEDVGEGRGLPPFLLPALADEPSPLGGLDLSPCSLVKSQLQLEEEW